MRDTFIKLSIKMFIAAIVSFVITYICFHFVVDSGFTMEYQIESNKPFITNWLGNLGTMFLFGSITSLLIANVFYKK